jgi:hypothetical protein
VRVCVCVHTHTHECVFLSLIWIGKNPFRETGSSCVCFRRLMASERLCGSHHGIRVTICVLCGCVGSPLLLTSRVITLCGIHDISFGPLNQDFSLIGHL